jgi:hypothetical protein
MRLLLIREWQRLGFVAIGIIGVVLAGAGCGTGRLNGSSAVTPTAVISPSSIVQGILPFLTPGNAGQSEANQERAAVNALSWPELDAKVGWHVLHPTGSRFLRDGVSRSVYTSPDATTYADRYFEPPGGRGVAYDVSYVEYANQTASGGQPGAVKTIISNFDVEVTESAGTVSASFSTGESLNGVPIRARVTAEDSALLYEFIALLRP